MEQRSAGMPAKRELFEAEALPHMDSLLRSARRITRNQSDAEDLVQEALVRAYRAWHTYQAGTNCRAWLMRILSNLAVTEYRHRSRSPIDVNVDDVDDSFINSHVASVVADRTPEQELLTRMFGFDVDQAINSLPDEFRQVITMNLVEGYGYEEIAEITDLPLGTVKSRLFRGRKLLQKALFPYAVRTGLVSGDDDPDAEPTTALSSVAVA